MPADAMPRMRGPSGSAAFTLAAFTLAGAIALAPAVAHAGCAGVTTDPRAGGLVGGLCGLSGGTYQQRIDRKVDELESLDAARKDLERRLAKQRAAAASLSQQIAKTKKLAEQRAAALAATRKTLAALEARKGAAAAELAQLESEVAQLSQQVASHMERVRRTELAARAMRDGALAASDQRALQQADATNRADGAALDTQVADIRRRLNSAP